MEFILKIMYFLRKVKVGYIFKSRLYQSIVWGWGGWVRWFTGGRRGSCLKAVLCWRALWAVGSWAGEVRSTQLERQRICQLPGDWVVLGDGVLADDKRGLAIGQRVGTRIWGRVPPLRGHWPLRYLSALWGQGGALISKLSNPAILFAGNPGRPGLGIV